MKKFVGAQVHLISAGLGVRRSLLQACGALDPTPMVVKKKRKPGPKPDKLGLLPDAKLAEMRGDYEKRGASIKACCEKFGLTYTKAYSLLNYCYRADVEAA